MPGLSHGNASDSETALLKPQAREPINLLGFQLSRRLKQWQFVIVFPILPVEDGNALAEDPDATWKAVFLGDEVPKFPPSLTQKELLDRVWSKVWDLLESNGYEVDQFESIDGDETFVCFRVDELDHVAEFAEARARLKPDAYHAAMKKENACPCDVQDETGAFRPVMLMDGLDPGEKITSECPCYVRYSQDIRDKVEPFTVPEQLRMARRHLRSLFSIVEMEKNGIITKFFALHEWEKLQKLYQRGWSKPHAVFDWPSENTSDLLQRYTGVRIAFFFHFYDVFTRWMAFPGLLSLAIMIYVYFQDEEVTLTKSIFGGLICVWATVFLAEVAGVRRQFNDHYRGTLKETFQNLFHWLLVFAVLGQFVWVLFLIRDLRMAAHADLDGSMMGIPNAYIAMGIKYMTTVHIKVVDLVWTPLSTWLSKKENHRSEMDLKSAMAVKLFAVKFVIFYFPFARLLLVQPYLEEGCPGHTGIEGCIEMLKADLRVFFVTQVISEILEILSALAMLKWSMNSEVASKKQRAEQQSAGKAETLSYIEVQAMVPEYDETEEIADYMQIVTNFGFIVMFGVICPSICLLCFLANFPIKKLTAFKFSYALRRVLPIMQDGIGSWARIMQFVAYVGISVTCYVVVFVFNVAKASIAMQVIIFLVLERVFVSLKLGCEGFLGGTTVVQKRIEEYNEEVLDMVLPRAKSQTVARKCQNSKKPSRRSVTKVLDSPA